jgi:FkbM family methyltransferase
MSLQSVNLASLALHYDLAMPGERLRSNKDLVELFFLLVRGFAPPLFVEVGAFRADTSRRYTRIVANGRAVAFEANPHNHTRFKDAVVQGNPRIEYLNFAVSDVAGDETFKIVKTFKDKEWSLGEGRHSLLARNSDGVVYDDHIVKSVTLDEFFAGGGKSAAAVWIDAEGAIGKVLAGGQGFLGRVQLAFVEVENKAFWEGQWLSRQVQDHLAGHGLVPIARDFEFQNGKQYNVVFVRSDHLSSSEVNTALISYFMRVARGPVPQAPPAGA